MGYSKNETNVSEYLAGANLEGNFRVSILERLFFTQARQNRQVLISTRYHCQFSVNLAKLES